MGRPIGLSAGHWQARRVGFRAGFSQPAEPALRSSVICETEELDEVPSMLFRKNPTTKRRSWLRSVANVQQHLPLGLH